MRKFINLFEGTRDINYKTEVLSGITVAMVLIPEAVAFALIAGFSPLTGFYAAFMMGLATLLTAVLHNLAVAVLFGVIITALVFAWDNAKRIRACKHIYENGAKYYEIYGLLFFSSVTVFNEKFDVLNDPDEIIINIKESIVVDMSAIEALNKITERYLKVGKKEHLKHLNPDYRTLLKNADKIIDVNVLEDLTYHLVVDRV